MIKKKYIKIIVNIIKSLLPKLIHPTQTSFIKGKRASDNVIIVLKVINHLKQLKGKKNKMMIKIVLEKAFDKIEWYFIRFSLNFPPKLIDLIMSCISMSRISILINGDQNRFF